MEMIERFLLYRIYILGDRPTINKAVKTTTPVFTHTATASSTISYDAMEAAEAAMDLVVVGLFPEFCLVELHA